jgi:hypothetical protein
MLSELQVAGKEQTTSSSTAKENVSDLWRLTAIISPTLPLEKISPHKTNDARYFAH